MTTDTRNGQSEADILLRIGIPLVLGDRTWRVMPRVQKLDREWLAQVQSRIFARVDAIDRSAIPEIIAALGDSTTDMLELIFAYEVTPTLDREWIEEHAFTREIKTAFTVLLEEAFPPFGLARSAGMEKALMKFISTMLEDGLGLLNASPSPEPTSLPSTSGASAPPKRSTKRSPTASSRS